MSRVLSDTTNFYRSVSPSPFVRASSPNLFLRSPSSSAVSSVQPALLSTNNHPHHQQQHGGGMTRYRSPVQSKTLLLRTLNDEKASLLDENARLQSLLCQGKAGVQPGSLAQTSSTSSSRGTRSTRTGSRGSNSTHSREHDKVVEVNGEVDGEVEVEVRKLERKKVELERALEDVWAELRRAFPSLNAVGSAEDRLERARGMLSKSLEDQEMRGARELSADVERLRCAFMLKRLDSLLLQQIQTGCAVRRDKESVVRSSEEARLSRCVCDMLHHAHAAPSPSPSPSPSRPMDLDRVLDTVCVAGAHDALATRLRALEETNSRLRQQAEKEQAARIAKEAELTQMTSRASTLQQA
ncbi:putative mitochondrial protein [Andalucia godoyi]|uniref:Putative mitochondrial protein n=1 Tax=Andalucia godoyi TaxID=505711 RepID=A0A8K0AI94_ANDGO|nr:putative mitochondrial protein [Andalucia godoyi]|eukprot:ANDGO_00457.mRNA.1 putative mitochondrial protein